MISFSTDISAAYRYQKSIIRAALKTLRLLGFNKARVDIRLVRNNEIKTLNKYYRNIDAPTDCLSFPQYKKPITHSKKIHLGDIIISFDKAREQAYKYGHSLERELIFLTIHSTLHLLGFDHNTRNNERKMRVAQRICIEV